MASVQLQQPLFMGGKSGRYIRRLNLGEEPCRGKYSVESFGSACRIGTGLLAMCPGTGIGVGCPEIQVGGERVGEELGRCPAGGDGPLNDVLKVSGEI